MGSQYELIRLQHIRKIWMLVPTFLLVIWNQKSMRNYSTTHLVPLVSYYKHPKSCEIWILVILKVMPSSILLVLRHLMQPSRL